MNDNQSFLRKAKVQDALDNGLTEEEFKRVLELLARDINLLEVGIFSALYSERTGETAMES